MNVDPRARGWTGSPMSPDFSGLRIGYAPMSETLSAPGDRRRFVHYARSRGIPFEVATPDQEYDLVIVSGLADITAWRRYPHGKVVYELIDSYLAIPRSNLKGRFRGLAKFVTGQSRHFEPDYRGSVARMCGRADAVVCSTSEQKADIGAYCDNVHVILDNHEELAGVSKQDYAAHRPFRLVWEGLGQNLSSFEILTPVLERIARRHPIELHLVTDRHFYRYMARYGRTDSEKVARRIFPNIILHPWRSETCAQIICDADLALIPLGLDDPFLTGKPENKLLIFWRMGMPVLTSITPAYERAMVLAGLDMICRDAAEWEAAIERHIVDEAARREGGAKGLACVETHYGPEETLARWDRLFASVLGAAA